MSRRVLVSGGSRGIGLAIARGCAAAGHRVTVLSRNPPEEPCAAVHLPCDLRKPDVVAARMRQLLAAGDDAIDAIIHCAVAYGSSGRHPLADATVEEWDEAMAVNARGLLLLLLQILPAMLRRRSGTIIGLSSVVAREPGPGRIPYAASKAAAHAVLAGLALELEGSGITVLELAPTGQVDTPGIRSRRPKGFTAAGYAAADRFVAPVLHLLQGAAAPHHGRCLWVDASGRLCDGAGAAIR